MWTSQPSGTRSARLARIGEEAAPAPSRRPARGAAAPRAAASRTRRGRRGASSGGRPAPRSRRVGKVSHRSFAPVAFGDAARGDQRRARAARVPPRRRARRLARAQRLRDALDDVVGVDRARACAAAAASRRRRPASQHTSAGRISVATCPGGPSAAATASAASAPASSGALRACAIQPRHVARHGLDVGLERRVVLRVVGRVVADDVHDRHPCPCARCAGSRCRCRGPARGAAASPPAARPCARSRRPRRWRRPRRARGRRASRAPRRAPRRSASRTCRGCVKQVSTPQPTSVRISACAPFIASRDLLRSVEASRPGSGCPCGSKARLMRRISSIFTGSSSVEEVLLLLLAEAVLAGDRAAELHAGLEEARAARARAPPGPSGRSPCARCRRRRDRSRRSASRAPAPISRDARA